MVDAPQFDQTHQGDIDARTTVQLRRSKRHNVLAGVCGGVAQYLGLDPIVVRLMMVPFVLFFGAGMVAYWVAAIVIPEEQEGDYTSFPPGSEEQRDARRVSGIVFLIGAFVVSLILVVPDFNWYWLGPLSLGFVGLLLLFFSRSKRIKGSG